VHPTNSFGANVASNNVYYVTNVVNADTCIGNLPGDITGVVTNTVNPRPTASLLSFNTTDCNSGTNNYTLTTGLTGIGPWTVVWNDGFSQTTNVSPLIRTVHPTNSFGANVATTNVYYITGVSNADTCIGNLPGDITGTNKVIINPIPTATLSITNMDFAAFSSTGTNMLLSVDLIGTNIDVRTAFNYSTVTNQVLKHGHPNNPAFWTTNQITNIVSLTNITLYVTNHVVLTGIKPWTNTWSDGHTTTNKVYTTLDTNYVWKEVISQKTPGTNFTFTVTALSDGTGCTAGPNELMGGFNVTVNGRLSALVVNSLNDPSTICNGEGTQIEVNLGGVPPWTIYWSDGEISSNVTTTPFYRLVSPVDIFPNTPTNYSYWVTNLYDAYTNTADYGIDPTNALFGVATVTVYPIPAVAPTSPVSQTNCVGLPNPPLFVTVLTNDTADWYDFTGTNLVAGGTTNYIPTDTTPGVHRYFVTEVNAGDCGTNQTEVDLVLNAIPTNPPTKPVNQTNCTGVLPNPPLSVTVSAGNVANWYDANTNLVASGTTNYSPTNNTPGTWQYFVTEVNASGCESTNQIEVDLLLLACTNPPAISFNGTNGTVQWFGDLTLLSTTNLLPPVTWTPVVTNAFMGTNTWYWTNTVPPIQFFKLTN